MRLADDHEDDGEVLGRLYRSRTVVATTPAISNAEGRSVGDEHALKDPRRRRNLYESARMTDLLAMVILDPTNGKVNSVKNEST